MASVPQGTDTLYAITLGGLIAIGPDLGHYALVVFGAWIGCLHSVAKIDFAGVQVKALLYMLRWIGTAVVLTSFVSAIAVKYTGFPADRWPGVVAFFITFLADKWPGWMTSLVGAFVNKKSQPE